MIRYRYHPEASADYQAAVAWYRERSQNARRTGGEASEASNDDPEGLPDPREESA